MKTNSKSVLETCMLFAAMLLLNGNCCFIVHFVYYGPVIKYDFQRISNFDYPYIYHLDQEINLPDNYKVNRTLTPVEKSDLKKMEVIFHHGGLYIDNDHFIDVECIKKIFCPLKPAMYLLDWTDRANGFWYTSVPISFIFSTNGNSSTIRKILTTYNDSIKQTIYYSGPFHVQNVRNQLNFIKVPETCQYHIGIQSWNSQKNPEYNWILRKWGNDNKKIFASEQEEKKVMQFFIKLWKSHSVIYPHNFNYSTFIPFNENFNHIQITDKVKMQFKVLKYSSIPKIRQRLEDIQRVYKEYQNKNEEKKTELVNVVPSMKTNQNQEKIKSRQKQKMAKKKQQTQLSIYSSIFNKNLGAIVGAVILMTIIILMIVIVLRKVNNQNKSVFLYKKVSDLNQFQQDSLDIFQGNKDKGKENPTSKSINQLQGSKTFKYIDFIKYAFIIIIGAQVLFLIVGGINDEDQNHVYSFQTQKQPTKLNQMHKQYNYGDPFSNSLYTIPWHEDANYKPVLPDIGIKDMGIYQNIHPDSKFDFINITQQEGFKRFKDQFLSSFNYSILSFQFNDKLETPKEQIIYKEVTNPTYIQTVLANLNKWGGNPEVQNGTQLYLASYLVFNKDSETIKDLQHYYFNKKYSIDKIEKEAPICVITTQSVQIYGTFSEIQKHSNFFSCSYQIFIYFLSKQFV